MVYLQISPDAKEKTMNFVEAKRKQRIKNKLLHHHDAGVIASLQENKGTAIHVWGKKVAFLSGLEISDTCFLP